MADAPQQRAHGRVGTKVGGKYRIDAFLAAGTMANVYAATRDGGERVALKILHRELASDPHMRERFKREGYFSNTIGHEGVMRVLDDDTTDDGCAFLVMELIEGETLEERRRKLGGKVPLRQAIDVIHHVLDILVAAHGRDVLHRDIKPDNVFIRRTGEVKLLDFGVARFNDGQSQSDMTGLGMVLGTPAFMPPEQALGRREEVDARSDLWAVGATLFVTLTGQPVHAGSDAKQRLIATARRPARPIRDVAPEVPRAVATVIDRALSFDRADRYESALEMREALTWARRAIDGDHELAPRDSVPDEQTIRTRKRAEPSQDGPTARTKVDSATLRLAQDDEPTLARSDASPIHLSSAVKTDPFGGAAPNTLRDLGRTHPNPDSGVPSAGPVFSLTREKPVEAPETERVFEKRAPQLYDATGKSVEVEFTQQLANTALAVAQAKAESAPPAPVQGSLRSTLPLSAVSAGSGERPRVVPPAYGSYHSGFVHEDSPKVIIGDPPAENEVPRMHTPLPQISTETRERTAAGQMPQPLPTPFVPMPVPAAAVPPGVMPPAPMAAPPSSSPSSAPVMGSSPSMPPGPALAQIMTARKRGQGWRIALTLGIGALAGLATYVAVMRHRSANAGSATTAAPVVSVASAAPPPPPPASSMSAAPAASAPSPDPSALAAADTTPAPVASTPKKKKRKKPPAAASATAAATAPTGESSGEPATAPTATATATEAPAPKETTTPKADPPPSTPKSDPAPSTEGP